MDTAPRKSRSSVSLKESDKNVIQQELPPQRSTKLRRNVTTGNLRPNSLNLSAAAAEGREGRRLSIFQRKAGKERSGSVITDKTLVFFLVEGNSRSYGPFLMDDVKIFWKYRLISDTVKVSINEKVGFQDLKEFDENIFGEQKQIRALDPTTISQKF